MDLTSTRAGLAVAVMAVAALGFAGSAHAEQPLLNGTYTTDGDDEAVWTISTACAGDACTGNVASNKGWNVPAKFLDGHWAFVVTKPDGVICQDGSYAPAYIAISVDPVTLAGAISTDSNYACPGGEISSVPFQLTRIA